VDIFQHKDHIRGDKMEGKNKGEIARTSQPPNKMLRRKLRATRKSRIIRFLRVITTQTPFLKMIITLIVLWLLFSGGLYLAERGAEGTTIYSYGRALYWGIAAFSTAGIADTPLAGVSQIIGGIWIVVGSILFFGAIVATVTTYFMRHLQHPVNQIIDTIEYNLEQLEELTLDELDLLRETTDELILHIEHLKQRG
jgi:voltage-gated potassium channel